MTPHPAFRPNLLRPLVVAAAAAMLSPAIAWAQARPSLQGLQDQVTALQRAAACLSLPTAVVDVPVLAKGAYLASGSHLANVPFVGQFVDGASVRGPYRNYFVYDLRLLQPGPVLNREDLVLAGELITYAKSQARDGVDGFRSDATDSLTLVLNRVAWMSNDGILALTMGLGGAAGFVDLADGPVYAHYVASAANNGTPLHIRLSDMAVRDLNRANAGISDSAGRLLFAIGGTLQPGGTGNAFFLGGGVPYATLSLKVRRYQGTGCTMPVDGELQ